MIFFLQMLFYALLTFSNEVSNFCDAASATLAGGVIAFFRKYFFPIGGNISSKGLYFLQKLLKQCHICNIMYLSKVKKTKLARTQ